MKSQQLAETRFASALDQGFQRREIDGTAHEFGTICGFGHGAKLHSSVSRYTSDPPSHGFLIAQILLTKFLLKPDPASLIPEGYSNNLSPPDGVKKDKAQLKLWTEIIQPAYWLTKFDSPRAHMWVALHAEFEKDAAAFKAPMFSQLRFLGSELGLDPTARIRMAVAPPSEAKPEESEFFD